MTELPDIHERNRRFRARLWVFALLALAAFGLLFWRLYFLQVVRHEELAQQAESNRTAIVPIVPNRGDILDRNGVLLAGNYKSYTMEITPALVPDLEQTIAALGELVEITPRDRRRFNKLLAESRNFESLPLRMRLTDEEVARLAAQRYRFPGVEIKARLFRTYPLGATASHVVGYIGRINQSEKEQIEDSDDAANYRGTDSIGRLGIEAGYERILHGTTGVEQMETSAGGRAVRLLGSRPATPGDSIRLSIDIKLQQLVQDLYGERRGALVAIDPRNGEVLAFVSMPSYDPNLFVGGIDQENWEQLNNDENKPLLNRALRGLYPPGSTYKPFMAMAALTKGARKPEQIVIDSGSWTFGGHVFRSAESGLGPINLSRAIVLSSDVYFYQLANDMGVNAIHDFMAPLGFGQLTGIDLPGEARGVLPSTQWKRAAFKRPAQQKWYAGETISLGIGQGYNSFTMLQLAGALATLANHGVRHTPHVARERQSAGGTDWRPLPQPPGQDMGYRGADLELVRQAMIGVTRQGTSRAAFAGAPYLSGGKTGTAQVITIGQKSRYNAARLAERHRDHSLYIAFAPADNPTIAVAAIVENAGWGASAAAPLVRRVLDYWVAGLYPSEQDLQAVSQGRAIAPMGTPRSVADMAQPPASVAPAAIEPMPR